MNFPGDDNVNEPRATALYSAAAALSTANSWTSVNGWAAARIYSTLGDEYQALTEDAALVDLGPLQRYTLRGPDAARVLARLTTAPVSDLAVAEGARGLVLDSEGFVVDFADLTRLSGDLFLLTTATAIDRRMQLASRGFDVAVSNVGALVAALGIVGPAARAAATASGIDVLSADATAQGRIRGVELAIRPMNVGAAPGVEIIYPAEEALVIWERVRKKRLLPPAGIEALEIIRIEGGAPRIGVDFIGADLAVAGERRRPNEIGLSHLAPTNRAWFNGRSATRAVGRPERSLIVLSIDADAAPPGTEILGRGEKVGRVTSSVFSPRLRRALAFAEVEFAGLDGRPLEALFPSRARADAMPHETGESRLAAAFRQSSAAATESRR